MAHRAGSRRGSGQSRSPGDGPPADQARQTPRALAEGGKEGKLAAISRFDRHQRQELVASAPSTSAIAAAIAWSISIALVSSR